MKNKGTGIIVGIVAAFVLLIAGIFVSTNNRAVSLEEQVFTADSDIWAQEKRRTDLIYNLADCVKEYDKHEAETLLNVVEARGNNGNTTDIENVTTSIAAVAEAYPELKSNENYKELMNELLLEQNSQLKEQNKHLNMVILSVCSKSVRDRKDQEGKHEKATERDTPEKETPESGV